MTDYSTVPAPLRSLEHVVGVFVRNLNTKIAIHDIMHMHISVDSPDGTVGVYRSEATQASINPQWNFLSASNAVLTASQRAARKFAVQVTCESLQSPQALRPRAAAPALRQRRTPPSWVDSKEASSPRCVFRAEVDLGAATHMGGDPFLRLSPDSMSQEVTDAYKKYLERSSDSDMLKTALSRDSALSGAEGEAALWPCLEMLPPNTVLVALEDGFYVSQAVYDVMFHRQRLPWQVLGRTQQPSPPPAGAPPQGGTEQQDAATAGAPEAMGPLTRRRPALQGSPLPPPSPVSGRAGFRPDTVAVDSGSNELQLPLLLQQITQLAHLSQKEFAVDGEIADLLHLIAQEHVGGGQGGDAPQRLPSAEQLHSIEMELAVAGGGGSDAGPVTGEPDSDEEQLLDFSQRCTDEAFGMLTQLRVYLMNDLRQLYPVDTVRRGELYKIKGVQLPEGAFNKAPAEQVGTALGHAAHCVYLAANHLGVPLRYKPIPRASFSCMQDDVSNHEPLPLFLKNSDPAQFARAYQMLQVCVQQLARSTGTKLPFGPSGHVLGNLQAVFETVCAQGASW